MDLQLLPGEYLDNLSEDLKIIQNRNLYCFNQDSLLLAEFVKVSADYNVVDLGTGSAILLLLLWSKQSFTKGVGVEIQEDLAEMAARSIKYNALEKRITILNQDLKDIENFLPQRKWDLVISNPPYIPKGQGRISPRKEIAIARQEICCTLEDVVKKAAWLLKPGGSFAVVHRAERLSELLLLLEKYQLAPWRMQLVASTRDKPPFLVLLQAVKSNSPRLTILPQKNLNSL